MADGSYYKGSFVLGEIEGHGYRVFANGSTYTGTVVHSYACNVTDHSLSLSLSLIGQFRRGEFYGEGLYKSTDGMTYEGEWEDNKRNGN